MNKTLMIKLSLVLGLVLLCSPYASAQQSSSAAAGTAGDPALTIGGGWSIVDQTGMSNGSFFSETWTFSGPAQLNVTDLYVLGDSFSVYDNNALVGSTPLGANYTATGNGAFGAPFTSDPNTAFASTGPYAFSHGSFVFGAGAHSITITDNSIPPGFGDGTVAVELVAAPVPEPASLALLGIATVGLAAYGLRRRKAAIA